MPAWSTSPAFLFTLCNVGCATRYAPFFDQGIIGHDSCNDCIRRTYGHRRSAGSSERGWLSARMGGSIWPYSWPILAQVLLAAVVADAFQHANIAIRLGPLSWIFSVGDLHRWHHSRERRESDTNYGNVYIFWDVVFGTRYLPKDRTPPGDVGFGGMDTFPTGFFAQLLSPFRWAEIRRDSSVNSKTT